MNAILWIIQCLLSIVFIMPGYGKIFSTKKQHIEDGHVKPENAILPIRILGVLEWLGCIGIIIPWLTGIFPILTPVTALCFALIMLLGMFIHTKKKEYKMLPLLAIIFILSATVAYFRFKQIHY